MLLAWIAEIADDPLVLDPADRAREMSVNTWLLCCGDGEDPAALSAAEVAAAFVRTAEGLRGRVRATGFAGDATFYVWYDAQAGQLRCSTASLPPAELPFGGGYALCGDLTVVVGAFLDDSSPGLVPWAELREGPAEEPSEPFPPLAVWALPLTGD
ncbi:hypothetical protein ACWGHU_30025 [Streptomyces xanthophaeus]